MLIFFSLSGWVILAVVLPAFARQMKDHAREEARANRYFHAVDDLDRWCGHEFTQARIIASHVKAVGEGEALNAGTPVADEPCTISGLRDQLRRLARI